MAWLIRLALVALIFVVAYVFVQRILAARRDRIASHVLRLVRSRGSIDLLDICRALSLTPTVAEAVLAALVGGGHLKVEHGLDGTERWRSADVPDLPEPDDDGPVN